MIIVDNHSTEDTINVTPSYIKTDKRIIIYRSTSRNTA